MPASVTPDPDERAWRAASKQITVPAIATFSDSAGPCIGTVTRPSSGASRSPGRPRLVAEDDGGRREVDVVVRRAAHGAGTEARATCRPHRLERVP